jgi:hypothetical protein
MGESSRMRKSIAQSRVVKVWFWDGEREYQGQALELSEARVVAFLRVTQFGDATVIPTKSLVPGLSKHLVGRTVEFKLTSGTLEALLKGKVTSLNPDFENPRRLLVEAEFASPSERNVLILRQMAKSLSPK